jgi:inorganic pyrophosphatase
MRHGRVYIKDSGEQPTYHKEAATYNGPAKTVCGIAMSYRQNTYCIPETWAERIGDACDVCYATKA